MKGRPVAGAHIRSLQKNGEVLSAPKAFILHLERATGRRPTVDAVRAGLPLESEILPAVDGARLSPEETKTAYVRSRFTPRYPFALGPPARSAHF